MQYATRISTKISYNLSHICSIHIEKRSHMLSISTLVDRGEEIRIKGRGEKRTGGARATGVVVLAPTWTTRCQSLGPVIGRNNEERFPPFPSRFYPVRTGKPATGGLTRRDIPVHPVIGYYRQPLSFAAVSRPCLNFPMNDASSETSWSTFAPRKTAWN